MPFTRYRGPRKEYAFLQSPIKNELFLLELGEKVQRYLPNLNLLNLCQFRRQPREDTEHRLFPLAQPRADASLRLLVKRPDELAQHLEQPPNTERALAVSIGQVVQALRLGFGSGGLAAATGDCGLPDRRGDDTPAGTPLGFLTKLTSRKSRSAVLSIVATFCCFGLRLTLGIRLRRCPSWLALGGAFRFRLRVGSLGAHRHSVPPWAPLTSLL